MQNIAKGLKKKSKKPYFYLLKSFVLDIRQRRITKNAI